MGLLSLALLKLSDGSAMHENFQNYKQPAKNSSDRSFGLVFAAFFMIVAVLPLRHGQSVRIWAVGASLAFCVLAVFVPTILAPFNRLWAKFGLLLHGIVSPVALAILFYGVVTPVGFIMRLSGNDPLRLRFDRSARSYWIERAPPGPDAKSLKNQF